MDRKFCAGCEDDFYNGNNPYGVTECWSLKDAVRIKRKEVGVWQSPPWNQKAAMFPKCYHRKGFVYVAPERTN